MTEEASNKLATLCWNLHVVCDFTAGYATAFTWDTYLVEVANIPAPYELFTLVSFIYIL